MEGLGSFFTRKNFNLAQSSKDLVLMEAIRDFFNNLAHYVPVCLLIIAGLNGAASMRLSQLRDNVIKKAGR